MRSTLSLFLPLVSAVLLGGAAGAQNIRTYVTTLGNDTLAIEQFSRVATRIVGDVITRQGGTMVTHYVITLSPDGAPLSLEVTSQTPDGTPATRGARSITMNFTRDTVVVVIVRDTTVTRRFGVANAYASPGGSIPLYELFLSRLRAAKVDSTAVTVVSLAAQRLPPPLHVKFVGKDSARIWNEGVAQLVRIDSSGQVLGLSGRQTTVKIETRPTAALDLTQTARRFAAADAGGTGLGPVVSPRDSVRATVGKAHISVDYYRPRLRGRDVFRNGVLGDTIWRTGANNATVFRTDADLVIGGATIPAGAYSLWTHVPPDNSSYELIFNKQTGQWGTEYHPEQDLARVPLTVTKALSPIEAFLISIESDRDRGTIKLQWGSTRLAVSFQVR